MVVGHTHKLVSDVKPNISGLFIKLTKQFVCVNFAECYFMSSMCSKGFVAEWFCTLHTDVEGWMRCEGRTRKQQYLVTWYEKALEEETKENMDRLVQ